LEATSLRAWWNGAFAFLLCLSLAAGGISLLLVNHLTQGYRATAAEEDRETEALSQIVAATSRETVTSHQIVDYGAPALASFRSSDLQVRHLFDRAAAAFDARDGRTLAAARAQWTSTYAPLRAVAVDAAHVESFRASLTEISKNGLHEDLGVGQAELGTDLSLLDRQIHAESHQGLASARTVERQVLVVGIVFALVAIVLVVGLARRLQRRVIAPVHELALSAKAFGEGDLARRPKVDQDDEIGRLAAAFTRMADAIADQHDDLRRKAFHDPLTGLTRQPSGVEQEGVLFIDLDDFKLVNDTMGHAAGDRLLQVVADRLVAAVRDGDVVARLGGDEFAVFIAHPVEHDTVRGIADRVLDALAEPFDLDGHLLQVGASIGVAVRDIDAADTDLLLRAADAVMYIAKGLGKNRVQVFDPTEHGHLLARSVTPRQ